MGSGDTTYSPELPEDVIIEVPLSTSITVTFACGSVAPEGSLIVPATLPASFWAQTLSVSSNKNKQMETIRNRRSIGLLSSSLFGSITGELNLRSFTLIGPERKGSVLLYRPSWHTRASAASCVLTSAARSSYWSVAIKSTPALIAAIQRSEAFSRDPKLYPWSQPFRPKSRSGSPSNEIGRSEEHTSELQSRPHLVCRLLLEKKKNGNGSRPEVQERTSKITT